MEIQEIRVHKDKMPEQKRSVKYKVEMFDLHSRVLKLLKEKDPDFASRPLRRHHTTVDLHKIKLIID